MLIEILIRQYDRFSTQIWHQMIIFYKTKSLGSCQVDGNWMPRVPQQVAIMRRGSWYKKTADLFPLSYSAGSNLAFSSDAGYLWRRLLSVEFINRQCWDLVNPPVSWGSKIGFNIPAKITPTITWIENISRNDQEASQFGQNMTSEGIFEIRKPAPLGQVGCLKPEMEDEWT